MDSSRIKGSFYVSLFKHFFEFGCDCGSLLREAFGIFKTFQKLSATHSFRTKFSPECVEMFSWATDFVDIITSWVQTNPLTDFEDYSIFTLIIPLSILMFMCSIFSELFVLNLISYGLFLMLGVGLSYINVDSAISLPCLFISIPCLFFAFIYYKCECCYCCCCDCECCDCCYVCFGSLPTKESIDKYIRNGGASIQNLFFGLPPTFFIVYVFLIPIMYGRDILTKIIAIVASVLTVLYIIIYWIMFKCCNNKYNNYEGIGESIVNFLIQILFLLIIPSTERFINLMHGRYINDWRCILSYIAFSLLLPLVIVLMFIFSRYPNIARRYDDRNTALIYFELGDIIKELIYAIFAGYDIIWGCLFLEIIWAIFILCFSPYKNASEKWLVFGNCLVNTASNISLLIANYQNYTVFPLAWAIVLVILGVLPAIVSLYIFYINDFKGEFEVCDSKSIGSIVFLFTIITPVSWAVYGFNIPLFVKAVDKFAI